MREDRLIGMNMIIYQNKSFVTICKPDHIGFMGVFLKDIHLGYPVGTFLEIKFVGHTYDYSQNARIPVIVNHSGKNGTGLRLKDFTKDIVKKWQRILRAIRKPFVSEKHKVLVD